VLFIVQWVCGPHTWHVDVGWHVWIYISPTDVSSCSIIGLHCVHALHRYGLLLHMLHVVWSVCLCVGHDRDAITVWLLSFLATFLPKELSKSVDVGRSYSKLKQCWFFEPQCILMFAMVQDILTSLMSAWWIIIGWFSRVRCALSYVDIVGWSNNLKLPSRSFPTASLSNVLVHTAVQHLTRLRLT